MANLKLHEGRARKAWPFLVKAAQKSDKPFTYKDIGGKIGVHHRVARFFLGKIQEYCGENGLPPLQALVVNAKTRLPGDGYIGSPRTPKAHNAALEKVRRYRWPLKAPF